MGNSRRISEIISYYGKGVTPKYVDESSIIVLNQKCVRNNKIDYKLAQYIDDNKQYNESKFLKVGDILINSTGQGTAGRVAFVASLPDEKRVIVDSHILVLRLDNLFEAQCLNYNLFFIEKTLQSFMDGSTGQGEFDKIRLFNIKVNYPKDSFTQQKIASVLSALDDKIELNNKINVELEAMAKTLYDYWFVQFDFPNAEGKPYKSSGGEMVYNEVLKRKIPKGWEVKSLGEIANITMGQSPNGTSYNDVGEGMIFYQGSTDFGWRFPTVRQFTTKPTRFAKTGDILLSVRAPVGTFNVAKEDCCIGRGLSAINSKDNFHSFLLYQMSYFKKKFDNINSVGTTFGSITKDDLHSLILCYPNINVLRQFEEIVSTFDSKIFINSQQNQELASLGDWLLPMLMNGQVKVVVAYKEVEVLNIAAEPEVGYGSK